MPYVPYRLRIYKCLETSRLLVLPRRLLRCNSLYLYLVALCNWYKRFFFIFSFLSYNPVNNPLRGYGCI
nr:MAG TPA: Photosystem II reaction centre I protein (PSII 4.8 kDa protein) [Caudoviricetes sp.]